MNYAQIRKYDVTNGPGVRTTLFVSGCTHNCPGCFNKEQQNFKYGNEWTDKIENEFIQAAKKEQVVGISILGGEPFQQNHIQIMSLLKKLKQFVNKPVWIWTGYTFEKLLADETKRELLEYIDVLIDGRFQQDKRDLMLMYRGSSNQRVIDVKESLKQNSIIELNV